MKRLRARRLAPTRPTRAMRSWTDAVASAVLVLTTVVFAPEPALASGSVLTAPYAESWTDRSCDLGAICTTTSSANAADGRLVVDLSVLAGETWRARYCPAPWPGDPTCYLPGVRPSGGTGRAGVLGVQNLTRASRSVSFTVTVRTDAASAESSGGKAAAYVWASAYPADWRACYCVGSSFENVVSSDLQPSASPATRTLTFTYTNWNGGDVPPGRVVINVGISAEAGGPGVSSARLSASVVSIGSSVVP